MTIRSDNNDKFAQPDGVWIGAKGKPTNVTFDGPALKGAKNVVLPQRRPPRDVASTRRPSPQTYRFITGRAPATLAITAESRPVLDGKVSGIGPGWAQQPAAGRRHAGGVRDRRRHRRAPGRRACTARRSVPTAAGGRSRADSGTAYEFVISAPGYATTHIYRSPFARSQRHRQPARRAPGRRPTRTPRRCVTLTRPRGYFGVPRDRIVFDGVSPAPGIPPGVAGVSSSKLKLGSGIDRPVVAEYESGAIKERIVGLAWPAVENRLVVLELMY